VRAPEPEEWAWRDAHRAYLETHSPEDERRAIEASLPVLRAIAQRLADEQKELITPDVLDFIVRVLNDRLNGWGWKTLTRRSKGNGTNSRQLDAASFAWAYIGAARAKRINDPDPFKTVGEAYCRKGARKISRSTIYSWRTEFDLRPPDDFSELFKNPAEDSTERAQRFLAFFGEAYQRPPSDTSPVGPRQSSFTLGET
jgi:hypothetical protein